MRIALVTFSLLRYGWEDDHLLADALRRAGAEAGFEVWDDDAVEWEGFDLVVVRSPWDYTTRREEFVAWAERIGGRLRNPAPLLAWNSDKAYLADLAGSGVPTVPTRFVAPGEAPPELEGEVVVKPTVSAGGRDTGRFSPATHDEARDLIAAIGGSGRVSMVQPYLAEVDQRGETAIVFFAGAESHVLRKAAVLAPDEVAPVREGGMPAAEAMFREDLVVPGTASDAERRLAGEVMAAMRNRFGAAPLYARVDMIQGPGGDPVLLELEAVEPSLYMGTAPGSADRLAEAVLADARSAAR